MIKGFFLPTEPDVPVFPLYLSWNDSITAPLFILDTGATGCLKISPQMAREVGLEPTGVGLITIANGQTIQIKIATAYVSMEGIRQLVSVVIEEGSSLAGIGLFTQFGYKVIVDCKNRTVELHKV